uniref:Activin types I and II receptor domain-containing protein n=1 Tax=Panagrolaimus superbus TaxID=310955 RepID=A0A914Z4T9_9BILA
MKLLLFSFYFIYLFSTINCLKCNSSKNVSEAIVTCSNPFCYKLLIIDFGIGNGVKYFEIEGCGAEIEESAILKPFNVTCKDGIQSGNKTVFNTTFNGTLYCCKTDLCNAEIPGLILPSTITPQNPSTKNPLPNNGIIVSHPTFFVVVFGSIISSFLY